MKTTYYAASRLDGYIAKKDGDVSWLEDVSISMEDTGYSDSLKDLPADMPKTRVADASR